MHLYWKLLFHILALIALHWDGLAYFNNSVYTMLSVKPSSLSAILSLTIDLLLPLDSPV